MGDWSVSRIDLIVLASKEWKPSGDPLSCCLMWGIIHQVLWCLPHLNGQHWPALGGSCLLAPSLLWLFPHVGLLGHSASVPNQHQPPPPRFPIAWTDLTMCALIVGIASCLHALHRNLPEVMGMSQSQCCRLWCRLLTREVIIPKGRRHTTGASWLFHISFKEQRMLWKWMLGAKEGPGSGLAFE